MFGKNPVRKPTKDGENLAVQEIFYTIQGEGPFSGQPAVFVRLAGCNLACTFCDTEFETGLSQPTKTPAEIANDVTLAASACAFAGNTLVILTGGEPLRQPLGPLIRALIRSGVRTVQIETAGTLWDPDLDALVEQGRVVLVCSPKTPKIHPGVAYYCRDWKYIIRAGGTSVDDGLPNRSTQVTNVGVKQELFRPWHSPDRKPGMPADTIWVSPCDEHEATATAQNVQEAARLAMRYGYRLSLQVHKLIGLP